MEKNKWSKLLSSSQLLLVEKGYKCVVGVLSDLYAVVPSRKKEKKEGGGMGVTMSEVVA